MLCIYFMSEFPTFCLFSCCNHNLKTEKEFLQLIFLKQLDLISYPLVLFYTEETKNPRRNSSRKLSKKMCKNSWNPKFLCKVFFCGIQYEFLEFEQKVGKFEGNDVGMIMCLTFYELTLVQEEEYDDDYIAY
eukprot:TRINITY_DN5898_c0_g1_i8.p10 TRINITY_DN5898_c0_g1~~TRINITY_DN5898_c0_g1_i8.p10  ORF type:complete len:132 (-),score=7.03 TRINITY_DN5898_c0_g1_i8:361-756(-)